jgi:RNA polymerase sigma-70 factor, ECF subfamily
MDMELDDKQLLEEFLLGDDLAFEKLVSRYLRPVYRFLFQLTRDTSHLDDLTQVTFLKAWKNIHKFDPDKNFKTWVFTIAKNTAYDHFKKKKAIPFSFFEDEEGYNKLEEISEDSILPDELLIREDSAKILEEALKKIPDHYRVILLMRYKDDFSLQEISKILDIPYNTVKSQHQRGLKILKDKLFIDAS